METYFEYAEVAVNRDVNSTFHYHIPEKYEGLLVPGHLVRVGFRTAMEPGIIVAIHDERPPELEGIETKPIVELLDPNPVMTPEHIALGLWMSETYLTAPGMCLWLMLPPGLTGSSTKMVHLLDSSAEGTTATQNEILALLKESSPRTVSEIEKQVSIKTVSRVLRDLEQHGILYMESVLSDSRVSQKTVRTVMRTMPDDEVVDALSRLKRAPKQSATFAYIARFDYPVDVPDIYAATGATSADLNNLELKGLIQFGERIVFRDTLADKDFIPSQPLQLIGEQAQVWEVVRTSLVAASKDPTLTHQNAPTPSPSPKHWRGESGSASQAEENTALNDSEKVPSLLQWRGDLGEREREAFEGWVRVYAPTKKYGELLTNACTMRKESTPAEDMLWQKLRRKRIAGFKFRRQHRINPFIVDFYCPQARLVIEVDGDIHKQQAEYDEMRQAYLEYLGLKVLRFTNAEVVQNLNGVLQAISETLQNPNPTMNKNKEAGRGSKFLLHGVTGSGKTEIYLQAIAETLKQGRQAIFLVPEIALTPQTIRRVIQRFPGQVALVHGSLSAGERYDTWRRARRGEIGVIVGTRSALFTPLPDIGLIILDEEHDTSYKQAPPIQPPYYHARAVAEYITEINHATLLLGSATPDMETFYRAGNGDLVYLHLPNRIMGHRQRVQKQAKQRHVELRYTAAEGEAMTIELPPVSVVDMRDELKSGNTSMFSRELQTSLSGVLERGEQAILFLNRRGQSTYVFCRDCGYVVMCENCDMPMTYHRHGEAMRCHHCNHQQPVPTACPDCASHRIRYFGAGTQQVETELKKQFPAARLVRWDADTAHKPDLHEAILGKFTSGEANVMVGTQMIAKGLDIPLVTLVGVINADPGLALPDFRASERAFQLLTQVAGRAGRGVLGGQVILQTYQPQHPSIVAAANHDYEQFYSAEIAARREMGYPPFRKLGRVLIQHQHPIEAQREIEHAANQLRHIIAKHELTDTHLIGPAPCFFSRIDKHYRWHLLVRSSDPLAALAHLQTRDGWYIDINPADVL